MTSIPLKPDNAERSNLNVHKRQQIDKGQNFNREGITKDVTSSSDVYNELKHIYGNHYSRYNIISNM